VLLFSDRNISVCQADHVTMDKGPVRVCVARYSCFIPSFRWHLLRLHKEEWPGWVYPTRSPTPVLTLLMYSNCEIYALPLRQNAANKKYFSKRRHFDAPPVPCATRSSQSCVCVYMWRYRRPEVVRGHVEQTAERGRRSTVISALRLHRRVHSSTGPERKQ